MKRFSLPFVLSTLCAVIATNIPLNASAISPLPCAGGGTKCLRYDEMTTTLRVHRKGQAREKRLFHSVTGHGGMFYTGISGLKPGTYSAKLGHTKGSFYMQLPDGTFKKNSFTEDDVTIVPRQFTITKDNDSQSFTVTIKRIF